MQARYIRTLIFGISLFSFASTASQADEITLKSTDGAFSLSGELLEFDGNEYVIKTVFGEITVGIEQAVCSGDACPDLSQFGTDFTVSGSAAVGTRLLPSLLETFASQSGLNYSVVDGVVELSDATGDQVSRVSIENVGASAGFAGLADGTAALGMSSRAASDAEVQAVANRGFGEIHSNKQQVIIGLSGLVILVSNENPVRALSLDQIGQIFSGKIQNWSDVGGIDGRINVYRQNIASPSSEAFRNRVLGVTGGRITSAAAIVSSRGDIAATVNSDPFGIGFAEFASIGEARAISIIDSCGIKSSPTEYAIKTEEYLLADRLSVYAPDKKLPEMAQQFFAYLQAEPIHKSATQSGYVDLEIESQDIQQQGFRFANSILMAKEGIGLPELSKMTELLFNAERLSATFRFYAGSSTLDVRAESDVPRLLQLLASGDYAGKEILFVGFSDTVGKAEVNAVLAEKRARQVLTLVQSTDLRGELDGLNFKTIGLGEVSPVACNDTANGRFINRRVEVWVRNNG